MVDPEHCALALLFAVVQTVDTCGHLLCFQLDGSRSGPVEQGLHETRVAADIGDHLLFELVIDFLLRRLLLIDCFKKFVRHLPRTVQIRQ